MALNDYLRELISLPSPFTDMMVSEGEDTRVLLPTGWSIVKGAAPTHDEIICFLDENLDGWKSRIHHSGAVNFPLLLIDNNANPWRLRCNLFTTKSNCCIKLMIRRMPASPPSIEETGLPQAAKLMLRSTRGLILVSGATGSGKSTTLAALVNAINGTRSSHIITIEDPIEYLFEPEMSVFSQREVGVDVPSFKVGVKNALRQRPDVIAIGEIVDRETAETALIASDSGHLVLGTIHANSAISTIHKLLSFFDSQELENKKRILTGSLLGIVSQVLLPSSSGDGLVLASELLLNHSQRFSRNLFEPQVLQNELESRADKVSQSMGFSLLSLIKCGAIDAQAAHRVPGLAPDVYKQIRALM